MYAPEFAQRITQAFGARGEAWLARLPEMVAEYAERWQVRVQAPFPNLSYSYVAPAELADGTQAVLKLGFVHPDWVAGCAALAHFAGRGCVRLLAVDVEGGAQLLERVVPGVPLSVLAADDDERATVLAAQAMRALWCAPPADGGVFPSVAQWMTGLAELRARFAGGTGPFPAELVAAAERWSAELLASASTVRLLHGDFHHDNLLTHAAGGWVVIDAVGVIGDPAYEAGAFLYNPTDLILQWPDLRPILARRIALLAEVLEIERARLYGWGIAQAILSGWWDYKDGMAEVGGSWRRTAEALYALECETC